MSYGCYISFKKIQPTEMLKFFREMKEYLSDSERMSAIAKDNSSYCPYIRKHELDDVSVSMTREEWGAIPAEEKKHLFPRNLQNVAGEDIDAARSWAMNSVFKYCVFYDEDRGLLGMFGVPDAAYPLFDGTVYFQNSCDQDYSLSDWKGIDAFVDIFNKWQNMSDEQMQAAWVERNNTHLAPGEKPRTMYDDYAYDLSRMTSDAEIQEFWKDKLDYMRRSYAYDEIWSHYDGELYNSDQRLYFALYGRDDLRQLTSFVKMCHTEHVEYCDKMQRQDFETICGQHPEKLEQWFRWIKGPFNYKEQMEGIIGRCPDFLTRNPQYREMYDKFMSEHADDDTPAEPEHEEEK